MSDRCRLCLTGYTWRAHPRLLRDDADTRWCQSAGFRVPYEVEPGVVWVEALYCDHGWRARLKQVDVRVLDLLLPDPDANHELRRRAVPIIGAPA